MQSFAPDSVVLAKALRFPGWDVLPTDPMRVDLLLERLDSGSSDVHPSAALAHDVYRRVLRRLQIAPVQDLRIDFGEVSGHHEHDHKSIASSVATEMALAMREGMLPPVVGIALPSLWGAGARRAIRILDVFLSTLIDRTSALPEPFIVSLADVTHEDQVSTMAHVCSTLESRLGLPRSTLRLEIGIASPVVVFEESGVCRIPIVVGASSGRCHVVRIDPLAVARAFGARDQRASSATRDIVRLSLSGLGIPISWGTSPDLPRSHGRRSSSDDPHRFGAIHAAWRSHAEAIWDALREGYFWGWDYDAGQLPARLAAVCAYYRGLVPTLRQEIIGAIASGGGSVLEEAQIGLLCGALSLDDLAGTGFEGT